MTEKDLWCYWQTIDAESGKCLCLANMASDRIFNCPYGTPEDREQAVYPCSDMRLKNPLVRRCECCKDSETIVYQQGITRQYYIESYGHMIKDGPMALSSSDGFFVECTDCGATTRACPTLDKAIEEWNQEILEYKGD